MISKELLDRFLKNECTAIEKEFVLQYLDDHPEEMDELLPAEECFNIDNDTISEKISDKLLDNVQSHIQKKASILNIYKWIAAAACIILLFGSGWIFLNKQQTDASKNLASVNVLTPVNNRLEKRFNTTANPISVRLSDGSTVELQPGSGISYPEDFTANKTRRIFLTGQALFKVARDTAKPFTVYTGGISTTALGTSFTIKYFDEKDITSIALHTGKVVIKPTEETERSLDSDVYLLPGQQLIYNRKTRHGKVQQINIKETDLRNTLVKAGQKTTGNVTKPTWYMFNGQKLEAVFDQLSVYYNADIEYVPVEIADKYFTAKLDKNDSLEQILQDIATLNHLDLKKIDGKYIIRNKRK